MSSSQGNLLVSCGRTGGWDPGKWAGAGRVGSRVGVLNGWKQNIKAFALQNFGILFGFAIMLILALYGETISVK